MVFHAWQCKLGGEEGEAQMTDSSECILSYKQQSEPIRGVCTLCN